MTQQVLVDRPGTHWEDWTLVADRPAPITCRECGALFVADFESHGRDTCTWCRVMGHEPQRPSDDVL